MTPVPDAAELAYAAALLDAAATRPPRARELEQATRSVARVGGLLRSLAGVTIEGYPAEAAPDRADFHEAARAAPRTS